MDESAEQVATAKAGGRWQRRWFAAARREQLESSVWPVLVVVTPVNAEHVLEMAAAEDEDPVEAVGANRAHPTLGEGVRVRGLNWRADDLDALAGEDGVEVACEFAVAVTDQEAKRRRTLLQRPNELPGLLSDLMSGRVRGTPCEMDAPAS